AEWLVRNVVVIAHTIQQLVRPCFSIGRRPFDVDQLRLIARELVFIGQPRDRFAGRDPPVALPVDPNEDVTLIEVSPIEVAWRMRPCTELEQDRREMQLPDRVTGGRTLVSELPKRRTDEDAQALIGRANDRGAPPI